MSDSLNPPAGRYPWRGDKPEIPSCFECGTGPKGLIHMGDVMGRGIYACHDDAVKVAGIVSSFIHEEEIAMEREDERREA